ncbi:NAD(P)-binding Rossmann-fold containing protein [Glarea lozoyensis ATCC 20868]|uniref:NAD(P)-binding Rossmann-fold containing protein n=1 Tax=Glarea lozoyensis (strain ATCC 20868 / MF5171) TaxID=1116229 RepID=S3DCL0_GLAL2|nr:NAD(P)-binding Rossmann-fold containing protein [Glarea lozoyensis ATCC 20868]EPE34789.1 NAD(P)-binding Rossmann-fold containing protein [Glarea lozoyensis ATCC 20868]
MLFGFLSRSTVDFNTTTSIPSLNGKVIAITGGNAGLGYETVLRLAPHNPSHIYILSRNASTTNAAISSIQSQIANCCPITHIPLDLSDLSSVASCAAELQNREERLDILFLNAGIMLVPPALTAQGYEIQFGTNHLGHFLLAQLLLPLLKHTTTLPDADVRVVVLSSVGMIFTYGRGIEYEGLGEAGSAFRAAGLYRYARSKLCNALFAREFAGRYSGEGITCVAVHPGVISTGLWRETFGERDWGLLGEVGRWVAMRVPVVGFEGVESGVRGQLWAAVGKLGKGRGEVEGGEFYTPVGVKGQGSWACYDGEEAKRLWGWSEKAVEGYMR